MIIKKIFKFFKSLKDLLDIEEDDYQANLSNSIGTENADNLLKSRMGTMVSRCKRPLEEVKSQKRGKKSPVKQHSTEANNLPDNLHSWASQKDIINERVLNSLLYTQKINCKDEYNRTPLHIATQKDNVVAINLLLKKKAKVNKKDIDGKTPLHYAAQNNSLYIYKLLIENGADQLIRDKAGQFPFFYSKELLYNQDIRIASKIKPAKIFTNFAFFTSLILVLIEIILLITKSFQTYETAQKINLVQIAVLTLLFVALIALTTGIIICIESKHKFDNAMNQILEDVTLDDQANWFLR